MEIYCTSGQATDDNKIRRTRITCSIPKAANTRSGCVIIIALICHNGRKNSPQWYIVHLLPVLLIYKTVTGLVLFRLGRTDVTYQNNCFLALSLRRLRVGSLKYFFD